LFFNATTDLQFRMPLAHVSISSTVGNFSTEPNRLSPKNCKWNNMLKISSVDGDARAGVIELPGQHLHINTPAMLVYTRRGGAPNQTPDLLEQLKPDAQALQCNVLHLYVLHSCCRSTV
jgi:hypothetical protein